MVYTGGVKALGIFAGTEFSTAVVQKCNGSQQRQLGHRAPTKNALLLQCPLTPQSSLLPGVSRAAPHTGTQTRSTAGINWSEWTSPGARAPHCWQTQKGFFIKRESNSVTPSSAGCHQSVAASISTVFRVTLEEITVKDGYSSTGREYRNLVYT